jgi:hypothetical protein
VLPFHDDFDDGNPATFWEIVAPSGAFVSESGGTLNVTFPASIGAPFFAGYRLTQALDLTACSVLVRVDEVPPDAHSVSAMLAVFFAPDDYAEIIKTNGNIHFQYFIGGSQTYLGSEDYDPVEHLWWRFRHASGVLSWETSSDGKQWALKAAAPLPAGLTGLRLGGSAFLIENGVSGGVKLDDFGIPPP